MIRRNQDGQALVETTLVTLTMFLLIKFVMMIFIIIFSSLWMRHSLYQALICLAEGRTTSYCEKNLTGQVKRVLPLGHIQNINWIKKEKEWKGFFSWHFYKKKWNFEQEFILP